LLVSGYTLQLPMLFYVLHFSEAQECQRLDGANARMIAYCRATVRKGLA